MIQLCLNKLQKKNWSTFWLFYFVYEAKAWGTDISYFEVIGGLFLFSYKPEIYIKITISKLASPWLTWLPT